MEGFVGGLKIYWQINRKERRDQGNIIKWSGFSSSIFDDNKWIIVTQLPLKQSIQNRSLLDNCSQVIDVLF